MMPISIGRSRRAISRFTAQSWVTWLLQMHQSREFDRACGRAFRRFAQQHPAEVNARFDRHFLRTAAAPLLRRSQISGRRVVPEDLSLAWWSQMAAGRTISPSELAKILPAASDFLDLLEQELSRSHPAIRRRRDRTTTRRRALPHAAELLAAAIQQQANQHND
jgi:hypothetical protein